MMMRALLLLLLVCGVAQSQVKVDMKGFTSSGGTRATQAGTLLTVTWPAGENRTAEIVVDLKPSAPLFSQMNLLDGGVRRSVARNLSPEFVLTVGKRDLVSQNGWNIFFDKVHQKPFASHKLILDKRRAEVFSEGSRTVVRIGPVSAPGFEGTLELTLYNGSPLLNVAAVVHTAVDSTAILYDAGVVSKDWSEVAFARSEGQLTKQPVHLSDTAINEAVKHRTIIGSTTTGSLAVFPAPHQYFYPLDEAFNLKFVWHGSRYRRLIEGYGMGIRQELQGDNRFVPWFNAPPGTAQRLNFFCLLAPDAPTALLQVKRFTHDDSYKRLPGFKTMSSHFHNEYVMKEMIPAKKSQAPRFKQVFQSLGVDIVHLGEFHYTAHPKGPDEQRLAELDSLFRLCERLSDEQFLLLPGEEPNEFFGGHWMQLFPKPVYWVMSRKPAQPYVEDHPKYGKLYHIANAAEMLQLLRDVNGLAWTAHARTKGSTGYPDKQKEEEFFKSDRFLGAAWKAMPADLSAPRLGRRVLDLMDDMNNWGLRKKVLAEADLFTVEHQNEMYAHMNVNYLRLEKLPAFQDGWQPVLIALEKGSFFASTGEVLVPEFRMENGKAIFKVDWTFPLSFAELISGNGNEVFRQRIELNNTVAFGQKTFSVPVDLKGRSWVRLEVWDVAVNGAFTQTIWLK